MRKIGILSLLLSILIGASGCSSNEEEVEQLSEFNFGKGEYEEPFAGILKSQPAILVKSLEYPPFSYLRPDTVILKKDLVINFNEECIRSKSEAVISFVDKSYQAFEGVEIYCNGQKVADNQYLVRAESPTEELKVELKTSPKLGESTNLGYVVIKGNELDLVNKVAIQQDHNVVANVSFKQTIGWPMMLWLSWLIATIILIWISKFIIVAIIKLIRVMKINISNIFLAPNPFGSVDSKTLKAILNMNFSLPNNNGKWLGERGNSMWIPDDNNIPPEKNYKNPYGRSWKEIKEKHNIEGIMFKNNLPDFTPVAYKTVILDDTDSRDFFRYTDNKRTLDQKERGVKGVHDRAFAILEKNEGWVKGEGPKYKEKYNLCWHELADRRTMQLVPTEIHHNISHTGGISIAQYLSSIGLK